jgi:hypothetical protein
MRAISLVVAAILLAGCAHRPLTPEQRAMMMHFYDQQQENYRAQQRAIQAAGPNQQTHCVSNIVGSSVYTTCN